MRTSGVVVVALVLSACGGKKDNDKNKDNAARFDGPMPVTFGACAGPEVAWVSGPKPLPFTPAEASGDWSALAEDDPPPPPPDDDAAGGTGTALALDEGKMGKRDSDRVPGQYKMQKNQVDPQLAREQAIEQARAAGILGSSAITQGGAFASLTGTGDISALDDSDIYGGLLGNELGDLNGGFGYGRSGFGPGGGGTGWGGTIGTGRYGVIGHGAGTGTGYGVGGGRGGMRGRPGAVPTTSIGQPAANGDLDKAIIRRYIKRNIQKITYCYEKQLLVTPQLAGTVRVQFFIAHSGHVTSAEATGMNREVASCLASVIKAIEFPQPKGGGGVQVNYPFTFRPADVDATQTGSGAAPDAGSGSAVTPDVGSAAAPDLGSAAAPATGSAGSAASEPDRDLFRSVKHGHVDAKGYEPGEANPLRSAQGDLVECLRKNPEHHGVAVVELKYANGTVADAIVHGLSDANTMACIVAAAKKLPSAPRKVPAERCSFAFGEMPPAALPTVDITDNAITFGGKSVATTAAVLGDDTPGRKIEPLFDAVHSRVIADTTGTPPVVKLHGPLVVRAVDATPLKVFYEVIGSVVSGGDDLVLATRRNRSDWQLLPTMSLPVVPVPYGTGGVWNRIKGTSRSLSGIDSDEAPHLSVYVQKDHIWVGVSRVNEFTDIPRTGDAIAKLEAALKVQKSSVLFSDRDDLEVAGDDDTTYGDLVDAIDAAAKTGFPRWQITQPSALAARPQQ
jgi:hypothetical protein